MTGERRDFRWEPWVEHVLFVAASTVASMSVAWAIIALRTGYSDGCSMRVDRSNCHEWDFRLLWWAMSVGGAVLGALISVTWRALRMKRRLPGLLAGGAAAVLIVPGESLIVWVAMLPEADSASAPVGAAVALGVAYGIVVVPICALLGGVFAWTGDGTRERR